MYRTKLLPIFIVLVLMCVVVQTARALERRDRRIYTFVLRFTAFCYFCGLFYFTAFWGERTGLRTARFHLTLPLVRWIWNRAYLHNAVSHVQNIMLFVPFGYLLPQFKTMSWWKTALLGLSLSLLIECAQYVFRFGAFQTDDLINNTMGAALGCLVFWSLNRKDWLQK